MWKHPSPLILLKKVDLKSWLALLNSSILQDESEVSCLLFQDALQQIAVMEQAESSAAIEMTQLSIPGSMDGGDPETVVIGNDPINVAQVQVRTELRYYIYISDQNYELRILYTK